MAQDEPFDESGDVACDQCAQVFPNLPKLMAHIRKADGHEPICKQCDIPFKNFHNLRHHKRVYHIQKMTEHVCEDCGKSFPNALAARSHWNFVHKIEDDLLCNICGVSCQNMKTKCYLVCFITYLETNYRILSGEMVNPHYLLSKK